MIVNTLDQHHYNLTKTAEQLKISRHALRYRMNRLNLHPGTETEEDVVPHIGKETTPC